MHWAAAHSFERGDIPLLHPPWAREEVKSVASEIDHTRPLALEPEDNVALVPGTTTLDKDRLAEGIRRDVEPRRLHGSDNGCWKVRER